MEGSKSSAIAEQVAWSCAAPGDTRSLEAYALALGGQQGVQDALELLRSELELAMALLGARNVSELGRHFLIPPPGGPLLLPACRL